MAPKRASRSPTEDEAPSSSASQEDDIACELCGDSHANLFMVMCENADTCKNGRHRCCMVGRWLQFSTQQLDDDDTKFFCEVCAETKARVERGREAQQREARHRKRRARGDASDSEAEEPQELPPPKVRRTLQDTLPKVPKEARPTSVYAGRRAPAVKPEDLLLACREQRRRQQLGAPSAPRLSGGAAAGPSSAPRGPRTEWWRGQLVLTLPDGTTQMRLEARVPVADLPEGVDERSLPLDYLGALRSGGGVMLANVQPRAWHEPLLSGVAAGAALAQRLRFTPTNDSGGSIVRSQVLEGDNVVSLQVKAWPPGSRRQAPLGSAPPLVLLPQADGSLVAIEPLDTTALQIVRKDLDHQRKQQVQRAAERAKEQQRHAEQQRLDAYNEQRAATGQGQRAAQAEQQGAEDADTPPAVAETPAADTTAPAADSKPLVAAPSAAAEAQQPSAGSTEQAQLHLVSALMDAIADGVQGGAAAQEAQPAHPHPVEELPQEMRRGGSSDPDAAAAPGGAEAGEPPSTSAGTLRGRAPPPHPKPDPAPGDTQRPAASLGVSEGAPAAAARPPPATATAGDTTARAAAPHAADVARSSLGRVLAAADAGHVDLHMSVIMPTVEQLLRRGLLGLTFVHTGFAEEFITDVLPSREWVCSQGAALLADRLPSPPAHDAEDYGASLLAWQQAARDTVLLVPVNADMGLELQGAGVSVARHMLAPLLVFEEGLSEGPLLAYQLYRGRVTAQHLYDRQLMRRGMAVVTDATCMEVTPAPVMARMLQMMADAQERALGMPAEWPLLLRAEHLQALRASECPAMLEADNHAGRVLPLDDLIDLNASGATDLNASGAPHLNASGATDGVGSSPDACQLVSDCAALAYMQSTNLRFFVVLVPDLNDEAVRARMQRKQRAQVAAVLRQASAHSLMLAGTVGQLTELLRRMLE